MIRTRFRRPGHANGAWLVAIVMVYRLGAAQSAPAHAQYVAAIQHADSVYGNSELALSSDGRWLALTSQDSLVVLRTTTGRLVRVPLPPYFSCVNHGQATSLSWNSRGDVLALSCSAGNGTRTLATWLRGSAAVQVIDTALGTPALWLPDGRRLVYTVLVRTPQTAPDTLSSPLSAHSTSQRPCLSPTVAIVAVACSDTVDILQSPLLHSVLTAGIQSKLPADTLQADVRIERTRFDVVLAEPALNIRSVVAQLTGLPVEMSALMDKTHLAVAILDSTQIARDEVKESHSSHLIPLPAQQPVAPDSGRAVSFVVYETPQSRPRIRVWSPDGEALAWWPYWAASDTANVDTLSIALVNSAQRIAVEVGGQDRYGKLDDVRAPALYGDRTPPRWTPNGASVLVSTEGRLWMVNKSGGSPRLLSRDADLGIWQIVEVTDRHAITAAIDRTTGESGLWLVDFSNGRWRCVTAAAQSLPRSMAAVRNGATTTIAYVAATQTSPFNVYTVRLTGPRLKAESRRLTDAKVDESFPAIKDTVITYHVGANVTGTAVLVRPASASAPSPTIVYAYPGAPAAVLRANQVGVLADANVDAFAAVARGYAFLLVDIPMPPAGIYGRNGPVGAIVDGMSAALEAATSTGWVDTGRLGVIGHSYGGYMVNALVTRLPETFQAAVSMSGTADLVSVANGGNGYGRETWLVRGQGRMGVRLDRASERYMLNSPVSFLDRVRTPLLLIHGSRDYIVNVSQSEEMFLGLAQLDKPVELVRYREMDHGPEAVWWGTALDWFDTFLLNVSLLQH